ncbi:MAG: FeoC-like transcriptional regulator [Cyanobacteria bacterium P01_D01_bin.56]
MILSELQDYITEQRKVSLAQMELKFSVDATALRGMLNYLIQKGRIQKLPMPARCHGCIICSPESLEFYECVSSGAFSQSESPDTSVCGGACHIESKSDIFAKSRLLR